MEGDISEIHESLPDPQHKDTETTISLMEVMNQLQRESYFRKLKEISCDKWYQLPSGTQFLLHRKGISLKKANKVEHRTIEAVNKKAFVLLDQVSYHTEGRHCQVTGKKRGIEVKQDEPQILPWNEVASIFSTIDLGKPYIRPEKKPNGSLYELILAVKKA